MPSPVEWLLSASVILLLLGRHKLPRFLRGLRRGMLEFRKASSDVLGGLDQSAVDAGKSLGGIYGKSAAQALTQDNKVAELYDPADFQKSRNRRQLRFSFTQTVHRAITTLLTCLRRLRSFKSK